MVVEGGIPGERVEVRLSSVEPMGAARTLRAELLRVVTPSPHRVAPGCRHFGPCGGCAWQHIVYPEQLRLKRRILDKLLREALGRNAPPVEETIASGHQRRQRAVGLPGQGALRVRRTRRQAGDGAFSASFKRHPAGGEECPVHAADGNRIAFAIHDELQRAGIPAATSDGRGVVRHIVVRVAAATTERMVTLVVRTMTGNVARAAGRAADAGTLPGISVHLNLKDRDDRYLLGRRPAGCAGVSEYGRKWPARPS